jgi:agmatinase
MLEDSLADGNRVVTMNDFHDGGTDVVLAEMPVGAACYISIDIDVLDMSLIPGCVSGEPDGLQYRELRDIVSAVAQHTRVVGFDVVEVNPLLDVGTGITSYLAAHTIVELLGQICSHHDASARMSATHRTAAG